MNVFKTIPFIRILLPFAAGILASLYLHINYNLFYPLSFLLLALVVLFFLNKKLKNKFSTRVFIIIADVFLIMTGINCCYDFNIQNSGTFYGSEIAPNQSYYWVGKVSDLAVEKEKTYKSQLEIIAIKNNNEFNNVKGTVPVYFKKSIDKKNLQPGNILVLNCKFTDIELPQNPYEFNYRQFMGDKNIFHLCFVDSQSIFATDRKESASIIEFGLRIKQKIIEVLKNSNLTKQAADFCIALLTGYDDEISPETINAFAHSGTLHILSVSGWHTGILYIVLLFLFNLLDKHNRFKGLRVVFLITALFFFTLITGFSAPVLRAAIMLSLLSIGKFYFNYSSLNNINILAVSAFLILFFNPFLIRDAGFLLSFSAIVGIVYFEPLITNSIEIENTFLKRIWQLCSVSISAQITTLPITLALFHQFPVWFIFSNLLIIPLCSIIIYAGLLLLIKLKFMSIFINALTRFIFWMVNLTDNPNWGYADKIDFSFLDSVILCCIIVCLSFFIIRKSYSYCTLSFLLIILWQCISIFEVIDKKSVQSLNFYSINKSSAFDLQNNNQLLFSSDASLNNYNYHVRPNHTSFNYSDIYDQNADYIKTNNLTFLHYNKSSFQRLLNFVNPDYVLVSNNSSVGTLPSNVKLLIVDGSNSYRHLNYLKKQCEKSGIKFYSTKQSGYLSINLVTNEIKDWR